jgi:hypothetical protein
VTSTAAVADVASKRAQATPVVQNVAASATPDGAEDVVERAAQSEVDPAPSSAQPVSSLFVIVRAMFSPLRAS